MGDQGSDIPADTYVFAETLQLGLVEGLNTQEHALQAGLLQHLHGIGIDGVGPAHQLETDGQLPAPISR